MAAVPAVRGRSIQVALAATGVVATVYLVVAAGVVAIATRDLTAQVDRRLSEALLRVPDDDRPPDGPYDPGPEPDRPFGAPVLVWTIEADGTVLAADTTPALPDHLSAVAGPVGATIDGTAFRIAGRAIGDDYVIVAQALDQVEDAQRTILLGELVIAPFLLGAVFVGAVAIGRRVAAPIEAARRRQLEFTADASHELRTPLSVIEAHTSLALSHERESAWYRSAFEHVDHESKRMRRLLEDMLWLARFDAAQVPASAEPVDLGVIASQATDRFAAISEQRRLRLTVTAPPDGVLIAASAELVDRLIGVLLHNACKYAPEGGTVDVSVGTAGGRASVTVDDSGPGVPDGERERIFDRFHRGAAAGEVAGAGLGLAIADAIVRATGGRWAIGASPAGGARFSVSWMRANVA